MGIMTKLWGAVTRLTAALNGLAITTEEANLWMREQLGLNAEVLNGESKSGEVLEMRPPATMGNGRKK